jgi:short-subunit dehydrogenase
VVFSADHTAVLAEHKHFIGHTTNNVAEYRGLIAGLEEARRLGADEVAAEGFEAVEANRAVCVTGAPNKAIAALAKILPEDWALALMARSAGRFRNL